MRTNSNRTRVNSSDANTPSTSRTQRVSRRTMLLGAGAAVSLPLLEIMQPAKCFGKSVTKGLLQNSTGQPTQPNRLAYIYFPNGVARNSWQPAKVSDSGQLQKLNRWMKPLEDFKQHLVIPKNIWTPRGNGHGAGTATWLTGGGYDDRKIDAGGRSVDQIAADVVSEQTLLPSLEMSVRGEGYFSGNLPRNCISWRDSRTPLSRETEPRAIFDRMFRTSTAQGIDRSVVDLVMENARSLQRKGSKQDQRKINEYLDSLRSIERRLEFAEKRTGEAIRASELTDTLSRPAPGIPTSHKEYVRLMLDMMVLAFWSDATRVSTFMLDHGQSNRYFNFIPDCKGTWHALSHYGDISGQTEDDDGQTSWTSVGEKRDMYNRITQWHHEQFAYLLKQMSMLKEADGKSLLDNSMICYGSSISDGHTHGEHNIPLIIAGGGGGTIQSGRQLDCRRATSMSRLHLSLLQRMGAKVKRFGDSDRALEL